MKLLYFLLQYHCGLSWNQKNLDYEIETLLWRVVRCFPLSWNQKNLDYEIETRLLSVRCRFIFMTWNQKNLDYEIETIMNIDSRDNGGPWNQKNLDYEIETGFDTFAATSQKPLEIKRTSITRLKRVIDATPPPDIVPWNQKNLDYEIETSTCRHIDCQRQSPWNQKNLDYEIETWQVILKWKQARLCFLKSKEPRLRDWNINKPSGTWQHLWLEIKRTSITRLKHRQRLAYERRRETWNQKNLDYEIETQVSRRRKGRGGAGPWNQKNLDYEIETIPRRAASSQWPSTWNQKNLDYEIETVVCHHRCRTNAH